MSYYNDFNGFNFDCDDNCYDCNCDSKIDAEYYKTVINFVEPEYLIEECVQRLKKAKNEEELRELITNLWTDTYFDAVKTILYKQTKNSIDVINNIQSYYNKGF